MARPVRRINNQQLLEQFLSSRPFAELWAFILRLNTAVKDKKVSSVSPASLSPGLAAFLKTLEQMESWVDELPPVTDGQLGRFGNPAFRKWHARLVDQSVAFMSTILEAAAATLDSSTERAVLAEELGAYFDTSFGNETRIDYGSGHEAHFCLLLHLMENIGIYGVPDYEYVVLCVFPAYLRVTRKLQTVYMLEPAGSHGVWGLDDYSFLPFLWGSSQLVTSARVKPTVVDDDEELERLRLEYLYLDAVKFIKDVKKGPFFEHSPMLYDISRVREGWPKINQGMLKMYKGEVWLKLPVVQAFLFGTLFPFNPNE